LSVVRLERLVLAGGVTVYFRLADNITTEAAVKSIIVIPFSFALAVAELICVATVLSLALVVLVDELEWAADGLQERLTVQVGGRGLGLFGKVRVEVALAANARVSRALPSPESTHALTVRSISAVGSASSTKKTHRGSFFVGSTAVGARRAVLDRLTSFSQSKGTDGALLDVLDTCTTRAVVAWGALVASLGVQIDGVLLRSVQFTDKARFTRNTLIDIQVLARLTVLRCGSTNRRR